MIDESDEDVDYSDSNSKVSEGSFFSDEEDLEDLQGSDED